jgi:hypothetical protein
LASEYKDQTNLR